MEEKDILYFQNKFIELKKDIFNCHSKKELNKVEENLTKFIQDLDNSDLKFILNESAEDFGRLLEIIYLIKTESSES